MTCYSVKYYVCCFLWMCVTLPPGPPPKGQWCMCCEDKLGCGLLHLKAFQLFLGPFKVFKAET
jgi:hypothetical protein